MRWVAVFAAVALSGCVFSSETPYFDASDAVFPIADGARFDWVESVPEGDHFDVTFHRREGGYDLIEADDTEQPMHLRFIDIPDTPEDDYIAQVDLTHDDDGFAYAYVWRAGDVYRVIADPGEVEPGGKSVRDPAHLCTWLAYHECRLADAEAVRAMYRQSIYPRFVAGYDLPGRYTELVPHGLRPAPGPDK